jgi:hypothetical protein
LLAWRLLESPHFVLKTNRPAGEADRILRSLEVYFAALTGVFFPAAASSPERLPVIALGSGVETNRYLRAHTTGVFVDSLNYQPLIVLGAGEHGFDDGIVRHELVHYAMRTSSRRILPLWYAEGMASYFETLAYDQTNGKLLVGRAELSKVFALREKTLLSPLEGLIAGRLDNTIEAAPERFYATSWLLVHALIHSFPEVVAAYERSLLASVSSADAWAQAAPGDLRSQLDPWLTRYFSENRYEAGRRMSWEAPPLEVSTRPLTTAEALAVRALLNLVGAKQQQERRAYHHGRATAHADAALEQDPENLIALQVALAEGQHPPIAALKSAAVRHRRTGWRG